LDPLRRLIEKFETYGQFVNIGEIARRYFAMNAFDGVLTIIDVLMGNFTAGVKDPRIVVTTGLTTCVAMGISGLWGAYLTEAAERRRELLGLEEYTLSNLENTRVGEAFRAAVVIVALVDGISPFPGSDRRADPLPHPPGLPLDGFHLPHRNKVWL
jgi:predicted membrane protein (TIGR00267 family)